MSENGSGYPRFIEVTGKPGGEFWRVNPDRILALRGAGGVGGKGGSTSTHVYFALDESIHVKQTPEEVVALIEGETKPPGWVGDLVRDVSGKRER